MNRFGAAVFVWITLLLAGAGAKVFQQRCDALPALDWLANRPLPANYQVRVDDLKKPGGLIKNDQLPPSDGLVGRHLLKDKKQDEPVSAQDLSPIPKLPAPGDGEMAFVYNFEAGELVTADLLEVGSRVRLCATQPADRSAQGQNQHPAPEAACLAEPVEVLAIHRKTSEYPVDCLLLKVSIANAVEFVRLLAAKSRFIMIESKRPLGSAALKPDAGFPRRPLTPMPR